MPGAFSPDMGFFYFFDSVSSGKAVSGSCVFSVRPQPELLRSAGKQLRRLAEKTGGFRQKLREGLGKPLQCTGLFVLRAVQKPGRNLKFRQIFLCGRAQPPQQLKHKFPRLRVQPGRRVVHGDQIGRLQGGGKVVYIRDLSG